MSKPTFNFEMLTSLPRATLDQIMIRARALMTFGNPADASTEDESNYDWLISGIMRELQSRGLNGQMPLKVVKDMPRYQKKFLPAAPSMDKWLRQQVSCDADRATLLALSRLAAECLAARITKFNAPVCISTMLSFYSQVPDAIEESFPGYCDNGWIPLLLMRKRRGR
jgi:hypothetical protein